MSAVSPELVKSVRKAMPDAPLEKAAEVALMFKDAVSNPIDPNKVDPGLRSLLGIDAGKAAGGGMQDWLSGVNTALAELGKEIAFIPNLPTSLPQFNVFDLSGPAGQLYPVLSPFRNKVARRGNGRGGGHLAKVITAISGSGTGLGDISPFVSSTSVPTANPNLEAARGNAYSFSTADRIFQFQSAAIYGSVTLAEFIASQGFQDTQALVATQNLQVAMQQEDKALLFGRNSLLVAPGQPTGVARAVVAAAGEVGITGVGAAGTDVYAKITAVGAFGETAGGVASAAVNIAQAAVRVVDFSWTAVSGALAYNVYASLADNAGGDPGDGSRFFYGTSGYTSFTVGAAGRVTSGTTVPLSDTGTGDSNAYQGWIQNSVANGAYSKSLGAALSGSSITAFQDAFFSLYQATKGNPDEIWVTPQVRQDVSALIMNGAAQPYRLSYDPNQQGGVIAGVFVPTVLNETTGKAVPLTVHPWLPRGNAVIAQYTLPFATAFGSNLCAEVVCVQDYMQIQWPMTTLRYESTVFWMSVLSMVAPTFQGWIHNIAHNATAASGPLS